MLYGAIYKACLIAPAKFWLFECSPADGTGAAAKQAGLRHARVGRSVNSLSHGRVCVEGACRTARAFVKSENARWKPFVGAWDIARQAGYGYSPASMALSSSKRNGPLLPLSAITKRSCPWLEELV
jgi:hypothetical protein